MFYVPKFRDEKLDVEIACPVTLPIDTSFYMPNARTLKIRIIEALVAAACTLHVGIYDLFADTYAALGRWIEHSGHEINGPPREIYLRPLLRLNLPLPKFKYPLSEKRSNPHGNNLSD